MKINPETLARASSHHPWRVIGIWLMLFVIMGGVTGTLLSGVLTTDISFTTPKDDLVRAKRAVERVVLEAYCAVGVS